MLPEEIERTLISSLKTPEHLQVLRQKYRITQQHFAYYQDEAIFVWDYIEAWGKAPDLNLMTASYPKFQYTPTDSFDYITEIFRKDYVRRAAFLAIEAHEDAINQDSETGIVGVISTLQALLRHDDSIRCVIDTDAAKRFQNYKDRADGISKQRMWWGIEPFDNFPVMLLKGYLVGVLANTKVGKSWLGLKIALANYLKGFKITIISPEFTRDDMEGRVDTILAHEIGLPISHEKLMTGVPGIEENYKKYLQTMDKKNLVFHLASTSSRVTVSSIAQIIKTDKPDMVLIDGIYLVKDEERGGTSWDAMYNKCTGLKALATEANVAIVVTNQSGRERNSDENSSTPAKADNVAYGYDFNRLVDILVTIGKSMVNPTVREVAIPLIRNGRDVKGSYEITFDTDAGNIGNSLAEVPAMSLAGINF